MTYQRLDNSNRKYNIHNPKNSVKKKKTKKHFENIL